MPILTQKPSKPRFTISIQYKTSDDETQPWSAFGVDHVQGDTLVEVLGKFLLVVVQIQDRINRIERPKDDDIPF